MKAVRRQLQRTAMKDSHTQQFACQWPWQCLHITRLSGKTDKKVTHFFSLQGMEFLTCILQNTVFFSANRNMMKKPLCSYIPRSKHNSLKSHKRWNDSWVWLLSSSVLHHALLRGSRLLICFCPLNISMYLLKCMTHIFSLAAPALLLPFCHWLQRAQSSN